MTAPSRPPTAQSEEIILDGLGTARARRCRDRRGGGDRPAASPTSPVPFFLVDPLDGTKGFIKGRPEFTINIGLIEARVPVFGLLYAPALADFYVTLGPNEAANARLEPQSELSRLADCDLRPLRTRVPDPHALVALTSQSHLNRATERFLAGYNVIERRRSPPR